MQIWYKLNKWSRINLRQQVHAGIDSTRTYDWVVNTPPTVTQGMINLKLSDQQQYNFIGA